MLPILHLNGYKIANPTLFARIGNEELEHLLKGYGWKPYLVEGDEPQQMHQKMAHLLDTVIEEIKAIKSNALEHNNTARPCWPMIIFKSPKGWTGPKFVDGLPVEGSFRSHQVPLSDPATNPEHLHQLKEWLRSYKPQELFDEHGTLLTD